VSAGDEKHHDGHHDLGLAMRNALVVGVSLTATWTVALVVRLFLPRHLGPELFGQYNFADTLAANGFGFLGLGLDTYVQKEVSVRPEHASDFYGGTQLVRLLGSAVVFAGVALVAHAGGYSREVVATVLVFGCAQLFTVLANTCATLLYAARRVGRLSALNVGTKLAWAGGVGLALWRRDALYAFAAAFLVSEAIRFAVLFRLCKNVLHLHVRVDMKETLRVIRACLPYYTTHVAMALYAKIDVSIMGMLLPDEEVGYYSAAANISGVAMLLAPLMSWVLMPQLSRAAARGREELLAMMRRALEWTLVFAFPICVVLGLGAELVVHTVFGARFEPSIGALRALSPVFVVIYVAMLGATCMILLERSWTVTLVTVASLVVNATLNVLLLRPALALLGEGGAGIGASLITVSVEAVVAITYVALLGRDVLDRRNVSALLKSVVITAAVVALDLALRRHLGDLLRVSVAAAAFGALSVATRTARLGELASVLRSALRNRGSNAPT
jgi:O-antigen/teichoic acid export membrane protein